jgi:hypothetical protein
MQIQLDLLQIHVFILLYGFSKFSILIGWHAVRKNPYPDRGPYFPYLSGPVSRMSFIWREIFALQTEKMFAFWFSNCVSLKFTDKNFKQPNCFSLFLIFF